MKLSFLRFTTHDRPIGMFLSPQKNGRREKPAFFGCPRVSLFPCPLDWMEREKNQWMNEQGRREKKQWDLGRNPSPCHRRKEGWETSSQSDTQRLHVSVSLLFSVSDPLASFVSVHIAEKIQKRYVKKQTSQLLSRQGVGTACNCLVNFIACFCPYSMSILILSQHSGLGPCAVAHGCERWDTRIKLQHNKPRVFPSRFVGMRS